MNDNSINREEITKAIDKYQEKHPLPFGTVLDVTTISSKESADIISETIEQISKKVDEGTELWCICEMAKLYMQGVKPLYYTRPKEHRRQTSAYNKIKAIIDGWAVDDDEHELLEEIADIISAERDGAENE